MKNFKPALWLLIVAVTVIGQLVGSSNDLDKSTVCKTTTVRYNDDVPEVLAKGVAASIVEANLANGHTIGVELRPGQGHYLLTIGVAAGKLANDTKGTFEFFGRVITDRYSPSRHRSSGGQSRQTTGRVATSGPNGQAVFS